MCVQCVLQVSRAFTFKQLCQRSDATLRLYFAQFNQTVEENDETAIDSDLLNNLKLESHPVVQFEDPNGQKCLLIVQHMPDQSDNNYVDDPNELLNHTITIEMQQPQPDDNQSVISEERTAIIVESDDQNSSNELEKLVNGSGLDVVTSLPLEHDDIMQSEINDDNFGMEHITF